MQEQRDEIEEIDENFDEIDDVEIRHWLWVHRKPIRELRIGTRSAGISALEFDNLESKRRYLLALGRFLCWMGMRNVGFKPHQRRVFANVLLHEFKRLHDPIFCPVPIQINDRIVKHRTIQSLDQNWCWTELRWRRADLFRLAACTGFESEIDFILDNRMKISGETVLILGLYAMHWPFTQEHLQYEFGFSNQSVVSRILCAFCEHLLHRYIHLIQADHDDAFSMWINHVNNFVFRVRAEWPNCPEGMEDIGCFVDGSANYTCRPCQREEHSELGLDTQRGWYNSYYGNHGQKFQGVVAPNGMFLQMYGPVSIRCHDSPLVTRSGLNNKLVWLSNASGITIKAHGDSAYPRRSHLLKHSSYRMAQKRICVEWAFGKMQQIFAVTDFEAHLQVRSVASSFF